MKMTDVVTESQLDELSLGGLLKGAKTAGKGIAKQGISAVGRAVPGVISNVGDIATAATGAVGNVAAQTAGGIAQTVGAAGGGLMHGYNVARHGGKFGAGGPMAGHEAGNWASGPANASQPAAGQTASAGQSASASQSSDADAQDKTVNSWSVINDFKQLTPTQQKSVLRAINPKAPTQTPESIDSFDRVIDITRKIAKN